MQSFFRFAIAGAGVAALALSTPLWSAPARMAKPTGAARTSVHPPVAHGGHGGQQLASRGPVGQRPGAGVNRGGSREIGNRVRGNNVVTGNTVVVGGRPGYGYYDNGRYYDRPDWDDDDDDFLEFVGKTAAVTAGVSVVSAVIGSIVKDKPQGCEPVNVGGQPYLNCNGTYYSQVPQGYQVVAPPR